MHYVFRCLDVLFLHTKYNGTIFQQDVKIERQLLGKNVGETELTIIGELRLIYDIRCPAGHFDLRS